MADLDEFDLKILRNLQEDAVLSAEAMAERVALSRNACWRRMRRLEEQGYVRARVAILDAERLGLDLSVMIFIRTSAHEPGWLEQFRSAVLNMPEITGAYRMTGDLDYVLRARVSDVKAYARLYQRLITKVPLGDVSASFVMEEIKESTAIPIGQ